jgi:hypothetical protein
VQGQQIKVKLLELRAVVLVEMAAAAQAAYFTHLVQHLVLAIILLW